MLRGVLIALSAIGLIWAAGAWAAGGGYPGAVPGVVWALVFFLALVFERSRYKPILEHPPAGEGWSATGEKFIDSRTGQEVTVWCEASSGKRAYVGAGSAK